MAAWESHFIQANGLRFHYLRGGSPGPTVVLVHGLTDQGSCWMPVADALAGDYDVIMVDSRGHGRSEDPLRGYGTAHLVADLAAVIDTLALERPFLIGHSMGGGTVMAMGSLHPDRTRAVIAEDPAALNIGEVEGDFPDRWRADVILRKRMTQSELLQMVRERQPHWSEAEIGPWAESMLRVSFRVEDILTPHEDTLVDWATILPSIAVPTLVIGAEKEKGAIIGPDEAKLMGASAPQVQFAHVADAGHSIRRDKFDAYMKLVREFLAKHR